MIQITKNKKKELEQELRKLSTVGRKKIAIRIDEAKSFGDLKENAEYHQAREDQGKMEARIREIESILKEATIIKHSNSGEVSIGSVVIIQDIKTKEEKEYKIVSEVEADILENKISNNSPMAQAMMNKKENEKFVFSKPNGDEVAYQIISIK